MPKSLIMWFVPIGGLRIPVFGSNASKLLLMKTICSKFLILIAIALILIRSTDVYPKHDDSTGLNNSGGRYQSAIQDRLNSVDPLERGIGDTQSWNGYADVRNRPTVTTDSSGLPALSGLKTRSADEWKHLLEQTFTRNATAISQFAGQRPVVHVIAYAAISNLKEYGSFARAAYTKRREIMNSPEFRKDFDQVLVINPYSELELAMAFQVIREALICENKLAASVTLIAHSAETVGSEGMIFGKSDEDPGDGNLIAREMSKIALPWTDNAVANFIGCKLGNLGYAAAPRLGIKIIGSKDYPVQASLDPTEVVDLSAMVVFSRLREALGGKPDYTDYAIYFIPLRGEGHSGEKALPYIEYPTGHNQK